MLRHFFLARGFNKRKPWVTRFMIHGRPYGGSFDPMSDPRIGWFRERFSDAGSILDLGSLEGAQAFELAKSPRVSRIVGLEGREANLEKANYVKQLLGAGKVSFVKADIETVDLTEFGKFEVVFCAGVLYHLPNPWRLVEQMSRVTDNAFIWTHYAADERADTERNGFRGMMYQELGLQDPQSGLSPRSFWLTFDSLLAMIRSHGFPSVEVIEKNPLPSIGPVTTLVAGK
jgi:SAM-dependent methyltransferase